MPVSATEVCNMALAQLAARRINSLETDESEEAKACRLWYAHTIETLLQRHQWSFATARKTLSRDSSDPVTEWATSWTLPSDCVRLIRIVGWDTNNPIRDFAIESRQLLVNGADAVNIVYVSNAKPVPYWPALFVDAVAYKLASNICAAINKSIELGNAMLERLEKLALPAAQTADARESLSGENFGPRALASMSALVNARFRADGRPPYTPHI